MYSKEKLMQIPLENISQISTGQTFRGRVKNDVDGNIMVIQMKDINNTFTSISKSPHFVKQDEVSEKQLLQKGDLLFLAKGNNNFTVVFNSDQKAVAVSLFFVIRPDMSKIIPEYLAWYLNQNKAQAFFEQRKTTGLVGNIKKAALEDIIIEVPPIQIQEKIAYINKLASIEQELLSQLKENRQKLIETLLLKSIQ